MLGITVELLTGRYAAMSHTDRGQAEWPPHPARFFSALVAALHDREPPDPAERAALTWLEQQPPPALHVDLDAGRRTVADVYVPVNDVSLVGDAEAPLRAAQARLGAVASAPETRESAGALKKARAAVSKEETRLAQLIAEQQAALGSPTISDVKTAAALLPDRRIRQVRTFPVALPEHSTFTFIWPEGAPAAVAASLDRLCARVTRLGHSSSLVRCVRVSGTPPAPTLVPDDTGGFVLRAVAAGQLDRLEAEFVRHQGIESRLLPAVPQRYAPPEPAARLDVANTSAFSDDWIVFERVGGERPLASKATDLTRALRDALLEQYDAAQVPGWLSGHTDAGHPVDYPHVAFVALPDVAHPNADGSIQGCAVVIPRAMAADERTALFRLVARWERARALDEEGTLELAGGSLAPVSVRRVTMPTKASLRPDRWARSGRRFISATPIALDRYPGNLRSRQPETARRAFIEAQRAVTNACANIGLPKPLTVEISPAPLLEGAQHARAFLPPGQPGRPARVRVHADIRFAVPVCGPVLLGAARYFGLGLCLPVNDEV